jgi:hypothetical protein
MAVDYPEELRDIFQSLIYFMNERNDYHNCRKFDTDRDNKQKMI